MLIRGNNALIAPGPADYVANSGKFINNVGGSIGDRLLACDMQIGGIRPYTVVANNGDVRHFIVLKGPDGKDKAYPVANATLLKDEWKVMDAAVLQAARSRLVGVQDLLSRGLNVSLSDGLGTMVFEYQDASDIDDADINMDAVTRGKKDRPNFELTSMPLPIIHKDFQYNIRQLRASRRGSQPLDTTTAALAGLKVAEKIETILFQGSSSFTYGGGTIYGYMDHPDRNTYTLGGDWDDSSTTGAMIVADVVAMKQLAIDAKHFGPFGIYIPTNYETKMDEDYSSNYPRTIRERILAIEGIEFVRVADYLTDSNVIMVELRAETVRMVTGLPLNTVEWSTEGGMQFNFKVMAIQVPQIRSDQDGNSGIVHGST